MSQTTKTQIDYWELIKKISFLISQPLIEVFYGIKKETIPYFPILSWGIFFDCLILSEMDKKLFRWMGIDFLYPKGPVLFSLYVVCGVTFGFWIWGLIQSRKRFVLVQRLTEVFLESGLKSPMGKLPSFIFDKPVDELVRRLRISNAFLPKSKFIEAKERLESALQVFIDEVSENKAHGTIDLIYSHFEIKKFVAFQGVNSMNKNKFFIGQTRAKEIYSSFDETPHLLIGGQTGGGKSTFLRQLITTLYCANPDYQFILIDMKGGLEFQIFDQQQRCKVISKVSDAKVTFESLDSLLMDRMEIFQSNKCKDIHEYLAIHAKDRVQPASVTVDKMKVSRQIIVIDEAAELFLATTRSSNEVQTINRITTRIAAQGRAVGLHLIIATQKPDTKAVSGQIKANLTGILSFPMATLGASLSVLGNGRAKDLPAIAGRAIWKSGLDQYEVQTPFMSPEESVIEIKKINSTEKES